MHIRTKQRPKLTYGDLLNAIYSATHRAKAGKFEMKSKSFLGTLRSTISLYITSVIQSSYKYNFIYTIHTHTHTHHTLHVV